MVYSYSYWDDNDFRSWYIAIIVVAVVVAIFKVYLIFACITARTRRRKGLKPYWGTGWTLCGSRNRNHPPVEQPSQYQYQAGWNGPPQQQQVNNSHPGQAQQYYQTKTNGQPSAMVPSQYS